MQEVDWSSELSVDTIRPLGPRERKLKTYFGIVFGFLLVIFGIGIFVDTNRTPKLDAESIRQINMDVSMRLSKSKWPAIKDVPVYKSYEAGLSQMLGELTKVEEESILSQKAYQARLEKVCAIIIIVSGSVLALSDILFLYILPVVRKRYLGLSY